MKKIELTEFAVAQAQELEVNRAKLSSRGYVLDYTDVYPDLASKIEGRTKNVTYIRGEVPLKLVLLLYDAVIVFVPPYSRASLQNRFGVSWEEFISLCNNGFIIPIIGKAKEYTAKHFDDLFKSNSPPISLMERGLKLLEIFGMDDVLSRGADLIDIDTLVSNKDIYNSWQKRLGRAATDENIRNSLSKDIALQYADLCIFGCKTEAESIIDTGTPLEAYEALKTFNEIRTYPTLFGLNQQANYNPEKLKRICLQNFSADSFSPRVLPPDKLKIMYEGIGIDPNTISVGDVIKYHRANLGKDLRAAMSTLNESFDSRIQDSSSVDLNALFHQTEVFQKKYETALKELTNPFQNNHIRQIDNTFKTMSVFLTVGTIAIGYALPLVVTDNPSVSLSAASAVANLSVALISKFPDAIAKFITKEINNPFVANMWIASKKVQGK